MSSAVPPMTIDRAFVKSSPRLYRAIWSSEASLHFLVHSSSSQRKTIWKGPFIHKEIQMSLWDFCIIFRQTSVSGTHVCLPVGQAKSSKKTVFLLFGWLLEMIFWCAFHLRLWLFVSWNGFYTGKKIICIQLLEFPILPYCLLLLCHKMVG